MPDDESEIYVVSLPNTEDIEVVVGILNTTALSSAHWARKLVRYENDDCWRATLNKDQRDAFLTFSRTFGRDSSQEQLDWKACHTWEQRLSHAVKCLDRQY
jgi:hypothetical protein